MQRLFVAYQRFNIYSMKMSINVCRLISRLKIDLTPIDPHHIVIVGNDYDKCIELNWKALHINVQCSMSLRKRRQKSAMESLSSITHRMNRIRYKCRTHSHSEFCLTIFIVQFCWHLPNPLVVMLRREKIKFCQLLATSQLFFSIWFSLTGLFKNNYTRMLARRRTNW